jgi:hypothetical protein
MRKSALPADPADRHKGGPATRRLAEPGRRAGAEGRRPDLHLGFKTGWTSPARWKRKLQTGSCRAVRPILLSYLFEKSNHLKKIKDYF